MRLDALELAGFRRIAALRLEPLPGLNLIVGANAQGKTSIIEAVSYLASGRSFRTIRDRECLPAGAPTGAIARAAARVHRGGVRHELALAIEGARKTLWADDKHVRSLSSLVGRFPVVVFLPEDLELARGGPEPRRHYLDNLHAQAVPGAVAAMAAYARALKGRNALLRAHPLPSAAEFAAFEDVMASAAARLLPERAALVERLQAAAAPVLAGLSADESLAIEYEPGLGRAHPPADTAPALAAMWAHDRPADREAGATRHGPHRNDFAMSIGTADARRFASQGQARSLALALRLAEAELVGAALGEPPLLLLDDILGELDARRAARLLHLAADAAPQSLVAVTDAAPVDHAGIPVARRFRIEAGALAPGP